MTALCNNLIIRPKTDFNADMATLCAELDRMEFVWLRLGDSVVRACTITPTACLAVEIQIADRLEEDAVLFTFQALEGDRAVVPALCAHLRRAMANTSDTPVALTRLGLAPFDVPPGLEAYPPIRELDPFVCYSAIVASLRSDKPHQRQDAAASVGRLLATRASAESMVAYEPLVQAVWHAALQEEYGVPPHAALALATMASYDLGAFTLRDSLRVDLCQRPSARSPDVLTNVPAMWARLADRLWAKAKVALTQGPRVVVGVPAALAPRPPLLPWHAARTQIALAPADPHSVRVKIEQLLEASGACYIYKPQKFKFTASLWHDTLGMSEFVVSLHEAPPRGLVVAMERTAGSHMMFAAAFKQLSAGLTHAAPASLLSEMDVADCLTVLDEEDAGRQDLLQRPGSGAASVTRVFLGQMTGKMCDVDAESQDVPWDLLLENCLASKDWELCTRVSATLLAAGSVGQLFASQARQDLLLQVVHKALGVAVPVQAGHFRLNMLSFVAAVMPVDAKEFCASVRFGLLAASLDRPRANVDARTSAAAARALAAVDVAVSRDE